MKRFEGNLAGHCLPMGLVRGQNNANKSMAIKQFVQKGKNCCHLCHRFLTLQVLHNAAYDHEDVEHPFSAYDS